jgi:hypothetical protein
MKHNPDATTDAGKAYARHGLIEAGVERVISGLKARLARHAEACDAVQATNCGIALREIEAAISDRDL